MLSSRVLINSLSFFIPEIPVTNDLVPTKICAEVELLSIAGVLL